MQEAILKGTQSRSLDHLRMHIPVTEQRLCTLRIGKAVLGREIAIVQVEESMKVHKR